MKTKIIYWMLASCVLCSCHDRMQYYEVVGTDLHTPYHIKLEYTEPLDSVIKEELHRCYHTINPFDSLSVISMINRNEDMHTDSLFRAVFAKAVEVGNKTDGMFDVTCAPFINLWGFGFKKMNDPTPQAIDSIRSFVGFHKVKIENDRMVKEDPRTLLNFSALGDGTMCDVVANLFEKKGIKNYMIEIGGEIMAKGVNPKGDCWHVGIVKPTYDSLGVHQELQQVVRLCGKKGLATSGNYRNYHEKNGVKYGHTINPKTGYPAQQDILSATIIADNCMTADAYATAFMAMGREKAKLLKEKTPGIEYFIIYADKKGKFCTEYSKGFTQYLSE
nr:FAD:protein FMN transferase [uncultured Bacteroides sp.]